MNNRYGLLIDHIIAGLAMLAVLVFAAAWAADSVAIGIASTAIMFIALGLMHYSERYRR